MTVTDPRVGTSFDDSIRSRPLGNARRACTIPADWQVIGGPINGGFVHALLVAAMRDELDGALPDPVSSTAHFISPTDPGPAIIAIEVASSRAQHATATARLVQSGAERARAIATFGRLDGAVGPTSLQLSPPTLPPPEDCETIPTDEQPAFLRRFDLRFAPGTTGGFLARPNGDARIAAWVRFADGTPPDTLNLVMLADALPPAVLNLLDVAWVPTLELTVHVRGAPAGGWLRTEFTTGALISGYLEEDGVIWDSAGRLVALSRQLARTRRRTADGTRATPDLAVAQPRTRTP